MKNIYIDMANLSGECRYKNIQIDFKNFYDYLKKRYKPDNKDVLFYFAQIIIN